MAANLPSKAPVLRNAENRSSVAAIIDKTKLRKEPSLRAAPVNNTTSNTTNGAKAGTNLLSSTSSLSLSSLRNRTNLISASIRGQPQLPKVVEPAITIKPDDWLIVPPQKPADVYNIDTDLESHLMCPSLAPSQYAYLMSIEDKFMTDIGFLSRTKIDTPSRVSIVNWMTTVHRQFGEQQESLFLAVNYFDRFLAVSPNGSTSISPAITSIGMAKCIAATALYIACKFEEIYAPSIDQICSSTDSPRATPAEVRRVEFDMLRALRFRVNPPLLNHFLRRCSKAAGATALLHSLGKYLIEISLYDPDLATGTKPSLVAAAASYIAILVFGERTREWDDTMQHYSGGYTEEDVKPVASRMITVHRNLAAREGSMLVKAKWEDMLKHPIFAEWVRNTSL